MRQKYVQLFISNHHFFSREYVLLLKQNIPKLQVTQRSISSQLSGGAIVQETP
jgi:hypothetical protein